MTDEEREKLIKETRMAVLNDIIESLNKVLQSKDVSNETSSAAMHIRLALVERYYAVTGDEVERPHI